MSGPTLMLVSAAVTDDVRADALAGRRPMPEYLRLEATHGVRLLDWTALGVETGPRTPIRSLRHARAALRAIGGHGVAGDPAVVFSDGEHIGIPLALVLRLRRPRIGHLMIGHKLGTRTKAALFRLGAGQRIDRVVVHTPNQVSELAAQFRRPEDAFVVVPYGIDTDFWHPIDVAEEPLVVAVGREHRDHDTLTAAAPPGTPLEIATGGRSYEELRVLYARSSVVVVSVLPTIYPFGVTALLEAMSMGKAVVVTGSEGLLPLVQDGVTALVVEPGDAAAMRTAIERLLADPDLRRRLGDAARESVLANYRVDAYVEAIAAEIEHVRSGERPTGSVHHVAQEVTKEGEVRR